MNYWTGASTSRLLQVPWSELRRHNGGVTRSQQQYLNYTVIALDSAENLTALIWLWLWPSHMSNSRSSRAKISRLHFDLCPDICNQRIHKQITGYFKGGNTDIVAVLVLTSQGWSPVCPCQLYQKGCVGLESPRGLRDEESWPCHPASQGSLSVPRRPFRKKQTNQETRFRNQPYTYSVTVGETYENSFVVFELLFRHPLWLTCRKKNISLIDGWKTCLTCSPASRKALAVPPDATKDSPTDTRRLAKSSKPVLSDTLSSAVRTD